MDVGTQLYEVRAKLLFIEEAVKAGIEGDLCGGPEDRIVSNEGLGLALRDINYGLYLIEKALDEEREVRKNQDSSKGKIV